MRSVPSSFWPLHVPCLADPPRQGILNRGGRRWAVPHTILMSMTDHVSCGAGVTAEISEEGGSAEPEPEPEGCA